MIAPSPMHGCCMERRKEIRFKTRFDALFSSGPAEGAGVLVDLSYAGALMTAAWILDEERKQDLTELKLVSQAQPFEDAEAAKKDQARAAELRTKAADLRKVVRALRILSEGPLQSGSELAKQALRQDPKAQLAYLASANYSRLRGQWLEYDRMMRYADEGAEDPPVRTYLRAMEAFERYVDPARCEKLLKETRAKRPDFVRAQANLVLVDEGIEAVHEELQRLKAMSPQHLVVRLAGPMIEAEYKTSQELKGVFSQ